MEKPWRQAEGRAIRRGEGGEAGKGGFHGRPPLDACRRWFLDEQATAPPPTGDHKGPPSLLPASLAPTDADGLFLNFMPMSKRPHPTRHRSRPSLSPTLFSWAGYISSFLPF